MFKTAQSQIKNPVNFESLAANSANPSIEPSECSIIPSELRFRQQQDGSKMLLPETIYIQGEGFDRGADVAHLAIGGDGANSQGHLELPVKYISPNLVACTLETPVYFDQKSELSTATLEVKDYTSPIPVSCQAKPATAISPMLPGEHAMYLLNPAGNIINGVLTFADQFPKSEAERIISQIAHDPKLQNFRSIPVIEAGGKAHWEALDPNEDIDLSANLRCIERKLTAPQCRFLFSI